MKGGHARAQASARAARAARQARTEVSAAPVEAAEKPQAKEQRGLLSFLRRGLLAGQEEQRPRPALEHPRPRDQAAGRGFSLFRRPAGALQRVREPQTRPGVRQRGLRLRFFREIWAELKKVVWPTRQQTTNLTLIVLGVSAGVGLLLGAVDYIFLQLFNEALLRFR